MKIYLVIEVSHLIFPEDEYTETSILGAYYNLNNAQVLLKEKEAGNMFNSGLHYWIETVEVNDKP